MTRDTEETIPKVLQDVQDNSEEETQVATIKFVGGPVVPRPAEGWTVATADSLCAEFFRSSSAAQKCEDVPGVDVVASRANCRDDVLVSFILLSNYPLTYSSSSFSELFDNFLFLDLPLIAYI